jgi:pyruvate dehydrogenase E2 component (dihydrolipoamide acetyltransferase)
MDEEEQDRKVTETLRRIKEAYGQVPLVSRVMSRRGDMFLAYSELNKSVFYAERALDRKTAELAGIAAGAALGAEFCLEVHIRQAIKAGASEDEVFEALMIGSMVAMTKSQAVAMRKFEAFYPDEE